jgi:hypothetical protein
MNNIPLQEDSIEWRGLYMFAFASAQLLTGLHVLAMELVRRERRRISVGQRGPCLADSVAFSYLYLFGRIVAVFPSVVLLFLALGSFKPVLEVYIIHFGLYSTLSGEVCCFTGRDLTI